VYTQVHPPLKTDGLGCLAWLGSVLYLNIVARHIKRFKTAVAIVPMVVSILRVRVRSMG